MFIHIKSKEIKEGFDLARAQLEENNKMINGIFEKIENITRTLMERNKETARQIDGYQFQYNKEG